MDNCERQTPADQLAGVEDDVRIRTIKPDFLKDEDLVDLPLETRLLFIGLWCLADSEGRMEDRPRYIKVEIFPYEDFDIEKMLVQLNDGEFIQRYEAAGRRFIQVTNFIKHQRISGREFDNKSVIPVPPRKDPGNNREAPRKHPGVQEGKGKERKGKEVANKFATQIDQNDQIVHNSVDNSIRGPQNEAGQPETRKIDETPRKSKAKGARESSRVLWKEVVAHIYDWLKVRKGGVVMMTGKDWVLVAELYDSLGPETVVALWDMWVEAGAKWSPWAFQQGYKIPAFHGSIMQIMDDHRWKDKSDHYRAKFTTAEGARNLKELGGVLNSMTAGKVKNVVGEIRKEEKLREGHAA